MTKLTEPDGTEYHLTGWTIYPKPSTWQRFCGWLARMFID